MFADWFEKLYETTGLNFSLFYDPVDAATFLRGLTTTLELSVLCIVLSILIGVIGAWMQLSRWRIARVLVGSYVNVFRNTPPLVQLYFLYFGVGSLIAALARSLGGSGGLLDNYAWAVISMSLFAGSFNTEIFRSGIEAVPRATIDAAEALGYSATKSYLFIILPLAFRICLPALNNNLVTMVKGTTICYAIGVPELLTSASTIWGASVNIAEMMLVLLVTFLGIVGMLVALLHWIERRLRIPGYSE